MVFAVELDPHPAMIGTRPFDSSTQARTTRRVSSAVSVAPSPVVPHGTKASVPCSICQRASARRAGSSTAPFRNGVTKATMEPRSLLIARSLRRLAADQVFITLPGPDDPPGSAVDEHFRRPRAGIVLRRHRHPVRAGGPQDDQV